VKGVVAQVKAKVTVTVGVKVRTTGVRVAVKLGVDIKVGVKVGVDGLAPNAPCAPMVTVMRKDAAKILVHDFIQGLKTVDSFLKNNLEKVGIVKTRGL
jgi:hypothetical protein